MKIAVLGARAMGCLFGGKLAQAGHPVTLVDIARGSVEAINTEGLRITNEKGLIESIPVAATGDPHQTVVVESDYRLGKRPSYGGRHERGVAIGRGIEREIQAGRKVGKGQTALNPRQ